jgi:chaperone modulatory protein CbpM
MDDHMLQTWIHEDISVSYIELCQTYHIPESVLRELLSHGLLADVSEPIEDMHFSPLMLNRIQAAFRLQKDLDLNLPGAVFVLELRDELQQLRDELRILRRQIGSGLR